MVVGQHVREVHFGIATNPIGPKEIMPGTARSSDVTVTSWDRLPGRRIPKVEVVAVVPDLMADVIRPGHTPGELRRKRGEYFRAGVRLVWEIDTRSRTVRVYDAADSFRDLNAADTLTGDPVLPGFTLPLGQLFAELDRHG